MLIGVEKLAICPIGVGCEIERPAAVSIVFPTVPVNVIPLAFNLAPQPVAIQLEPVTITVTPGILSVSYTGWVEQTCPDDQGNWSEEPCPT